MPLVRGSLYRYHYLWSRERWQGEESGRKARPVCLVMKSDANPATRFLFPLTTREPPSYLIALAIDVAECRRSNLVFPSWVVLEEYNRAVSDELYDFDSLDAIGQFGDAFMKRIALEIKRASTMKRLKAVDR
jgi:hypothetical protein